MRIIFSTLFYFVLSCGALAQPHISAWDLRQQSQDYVRKLYSCRTSYLGCTIEQKLALAEIEGKIHTKSFLDDTLAKNTEETKYIPLAPENSDLLAMAAVTSLGIVAFYSDQQITDSIQSNKSKTTETISSIGNFLGGGAVLPIAAGAYFLGVYYKDNKLKKVGLFTVGSSIAMGIVTAGVKYASGRKRPKEGEGPYQFGNPDHKSFYSGHTAQAFTIATVISELYKEDYPVVPWVAYGLASVTAYARVHDNMHWASDVIIGAIAGHLITKYTLYVFENVIVYPTVDPHSGAYMITLQYAPKGKMPPMACSKIENKYARVDACIAEVFAKAGRGW